MRKTLGWFCVLTWLALGLGAVLAATPQQKSSSSKKAASKKTGSKGGTKAKSGGKSAPKKSSGAAKKGTARKSAGKSGSTAKSGKSGSKSGKKTASKSDKSAPKTTWRNRQLTPTPERYKEIQQALVAKGFLNTEDANGAWGPNSIDALKKFQATQNIEATGKINSLSLIALGLGPKREPSAAVKPPAPAAPEQ